MKITNLVLVSLVLAATARAESVKQECVLPKAYIDGMPFVAHINLENPGKQVATVPVGLCDGGAFTFNGEPLVEGAGKGTLRLLPGAKLDLSFDLSSALEGQAAKEKRFKIGWGDKSFDVTHLVPAKSGLDFMTLPAAELKNYQVVLRTNHGDMRVEFYPDVAPNHVRNFLDLAYTKFYDGTLFHRVKSDFMIQGGDPNTKSGNASSWGTGSGPRPVKHEFSDKKHARGILSMARSQDVDSASCQFFVMTAPAPFLDGKYSIFGNLVDGDATLDAIGNAAGQAGPDGTIRPKDPQRIDSAIVVVAPN